MNSDGWWFITVYLMLPSVILEPLYQVFENFVYQPPLWLSMLVVMAIPVLSFPLMVCIMWAIEWSAMFIMDGSYYLRQASKMVRKTARS